MGCGGSKQSSANAGAISPRKKSDMLITKTADQIPEAGPESAGSCQESGKEVKDIIVTENNEAKANEGALEKGEEERMRNADGNLMSKDSPDRYFSPRREAHGADSVTGGEGFEYYSPVHESALQGSLTGGDEAVPLSVEVSEETNAGSVALNKGAE